MTQNVVRARKVITRTAVVFKVTSNVARVSKRELLIWLFQTCVVMFLCSPWGFELLFSQRAQRFSLVSSHPGVPCVRGRYGPKAFSNKSCFPIQMCICLMGLSSHHSARDTKTKHCKGKSNLFPGLDDCEKDQMHSNSRTEP